jgi:hypothetical protein
MRDEPEDAVIQFKENVDHMLKSNAIRTKEMFCSQKHSRKEE